MPQGEVVGIIGRNGAGKSTLLKILSRITEPTDGRVEIRGRVGSLLEVGTGFHPELTGRENIFLNGAILGMTRTEIDRKFDEIVAFAEVEKFIDTPVKHYSSGMYMRLAFAVAAHLEPEILLVDEVLAVGDARVSAEVPRQDGRRRRQGRTVLLVTHNIAAVAALCSQALHLHRGCVSAVGDVGHVIESYGRATNADVCAVATFRPDPQQACFTEIAVPTAGLKFGDTLPIATSIQAATATEVAIEIEVHDEKGLPVAYTSTAPLAGRTFKLEPGSPRKVLIELGPLSLASGRYYLSFWLMKPWTENYHVVHHAVFFDIDSADPCGTGFEFRQSYGRGSVTFPMRVSEG